MTLPRAGLRSSRRLRRLSLAAALLLGAPALLSAHGALRRSMPASGEHLAEAPRQLRLTFTEPPVLSATIVQLLAPDSTAVRLGPMRVDSTHTVVVDVVGALAAGVHTVRWQVVGDDGHPVRGSYSFTIAQGATGLADPATASRTDTASTAAHHDPVALPIGESFDAESPPYVVIRWVGFTALLVIIGVAAFRWIVIVLLRRRDPSRRRQAFASRALHSAARLGITAAALCLVAAIARLYAQSLALHGADRVLDRALVLPLLGGTVWGLGWSLQVAAALLAILGFALVLGRRGGGWAIAALAAVMLAVTPALSGHAVATPRLTTVAVLADTLHVIGAGGWLGSLLVVVVAGLRTAACLPREERDGTIADLVNAFSPAALVFTAAVVVTGAFAAWLHLDSPAALWQSDYGRVLLLKLALFSLAAAIGAYNWLRVRPALGAAGGEVRLARSAKTELVVAAVVLAATAVLVATPIDMPRAP